MIEVYLDGNRWAWRLITACGRAIVTSAETFACGMSAATDAKRYRSTFWSIADAIDHRQGRCI